MRPAAKSVFCGTVSVSACWLGVCIEGYQLRLCSILYIIVFLDSVSLAVCYGVLGTANSVLWCRQSLCRVIYVMYISGGSPLHHFRFVDVLFGGGVPDDRSVFKLSSNKGLIMFSMI